MFILASLLALHALIASVSAEFFNSNRPGRNLIVLSAPSIWDESYKDIFDTLIAFQMELARTFHDHDNVVILADKHTMPYFDGRSRTVKTRLPLDVLIQAAIYDTNIRDFAPFGVRQLVKFTYRPPGLAPIAASQIDLSIRRFMDDIKLKVDRREPELILSAESVVDNGVNKAIIDERVLAENHGRLPDWAIMIKLFNAFKKVAVISNPFNATRLRLDDVMSFVDDQILVIPTMDNESKQYLENELFKKFRDEVMLVELPTQFNTDRKGNCGMYTSILTTDKHVYVPVFGNDPANWKRGHSTMMDKIVIHLLEVNTRKMVIPVNIPRSICERGISLRSLTWTLRGNAAEHIVNVARNTPTRLLL